MIEFMDAYSTRGAADVLWDLMLERQGEDSQNISFKMPTRDAHEAFILKTPYAHWYLVKDNEAWIGSVSATWQNAVGIVLFQAYRGQGYGRATLEKFLALARPFPASAGDYPGYFVANIAPSNERSIHLFRSLGFELIQQTYARKEGKG